MILSLSSPSVPFAGHHPGGAKTSRAFCPASRVSTSVRAIIRALALQRRPVCKSIPRPPQPSLQSFLRDQGSTRILAVGTVFHDLRVWKPKIRSAVEFGKAIEGIETN